MVPKLLILPAAGSASTLTPYALGMPSKLEIDSTRNQAKAMSSFGDHREDNYAASAEPSSDVASRVGLRDDEPRIEVIRRLPPAVSLQQPVHSVVVGQHVAAQASNAPRRGGVGELAEQ